MKNVKQLTIIEIGLNQLNKQKGLPTLLSDGINKQPNSSSSQSMVEIKKSDTFIQQKASNKLVNKNEQTNRVRINNNKQSISLKRNESF